MLPQVTLNSEPQSDGIKRKGSDCDVEEVIPWLGLYLSGRIVTYHAQDPPVGTG